MTPRLSSSLETSVPPEALTRPDVESAIEELLGVLDLEGKVRLLTGQTSWRLYTDDRIGLRSMAVSDGPAGVRGTAEVPGETSLLFPSPSALSATWDTALASRLGSLFAAEARRHGVDVVLAPQVNLQRTPVGGRHYECYSEDPLLTSVISGHVIAAMQAGGVGACLKHFVANDSETQRTEYLAHVDERTLREVYLAPFEHAVREVGVWTVMAAYNQIDDGVLAAPATEHTHLLRDVLKDEWGFDGVVISDWLATRRTAESANGGLDLVMPGPGGPWEHRLVDAVRAGQVDESVVDDKVRRLLRLAVRVGALTEIAPEPATPATDHTLLRELAARATVVVRDEDHRLPLDGAAVRRVALIGPNAFEAFVQGGGSAHVNSAHVVSPAEGFRAALPLAEVTVLRGGDARRHAPDLDVARRGRDPRTGEPGLRISTLDAAGVVLASRVTTDWDGWERELPDAAACVLVEATVHLAEPGEHRIGLGTVGVWTFEVDGLVIGHGEHPAGAEVVLDSSVNSPDDDPAVVLIDAPRDIELRATLQNIRAQAYGSFARGVLRHALPGPSIDDEIAAAVEAATQADLVVVVVGTNDEVESEGWDRTSLALPGRQDDLVARVLAVAPDAVVVVNAGAPVLLPWLETARTVLWTWFPGEECGNALADVLLGATEPAGRLPWTLPAAEADVPVPHARPGADGVLAYREGVHVGYRGWELSGAQPAAAFGHGLGWTTWQYDDARVVEVSAEHVVLAADLTNVGPRRGTEVVQVYLEAPEGAALDRPVRWLAGFATVHGDAGDRVTATVRVAHRAFETWDVSTHRWVTPPGTYLFRVGRSVRDLRLATATDR
ncbi:MAG: beta-glucosidase [Cellulomonas sp.]